MKLFSILFVLLVFLSIFQCKSMELNEKIPQNNLNKVTDHYEENPTKTKEQRLLTIESEPFKINYVIVSWLKKYASRNDICHYLCQSDSIFDFSSTLSCYGSYNCNSMIWRDLTIFFLIVSYVILPIFMIILKIWNFRCLSDHIAILTGIVILNSFYQKVSKQFEESMETDYDISSSEIQSEIKNSESEIPG